MQPPLGDLLVILLDDPLKPKINLGQLEVAKNSCSDQYVGDCSPAECHEPEPGYDCHDLDQTMEQDHVDSDDHPYEHGRIRVHDGCHQHAADNRQGVYPCQDERDPRRQIEPGVNNRHSR